jgi:hypothetical protein
VTAGKWSQRLLAEEYRTGKLNNLPTLVVSGHLDLSTPAGFASEKLIPLVIYDLFY